MFAKPSCDNVLQPELLAATHYHTRAWANIKTGKKCYIIIVIYPKAVADIEIRKIGKSDHFKIKIKIQSFESSEEEKSIRSYHPYTAQNDIVFRWHLSQSGL